jgi:hypothetical protein
MGDPKDDSGDKPMVHKDGVSHDQRGNAVWKWAADSGRHLLESTSALLKRLEVPGLKLEEDASGPRKQPGLELEEGGAARGNVGYDPYGGRRTTSAPPARPASATKPVAAARPSTAAKPIAAKPTAAVRPAAGASPGGAARPAATKPAAVPPPRPSLLRRWFGKD